MQSRSSIPPPTRRPTTARSAPPWRGRGADVELVTSRFAHGPVPAAEGYRVARVFYRRSAGAGGQTGRRRALKAGRARRRHAPLPARRRARRRRPLPVAARSPRSTAACCPPPSAGAHRPRRCSARRPRQDARPRPARALERMDAIVDPVGARSARLREEAGIAAERVRVIPHGAFDYLTRLPDAVPLPDELAAVEGPVILCFGLIRPYKGVDVLLEAFRSVEGAELWVVGRPLGVSLDALRELASRAPGTGALRPQVRARPRAAGLLPPRRPGGPSAPRRRAVRRSVRGARLRQADRDERRRRIRGGGGARRGAPRPAGRPARRSRPR